ncbi:hypothetical protein ACIPUD_38505 [Bradyrhizobium sp. CAR08]
MKLIKPLPSEPAASTVLLGKDRRGNWVVREENGAFGGVFVQRDHALKYALSKNGHHPETIFDVPPEVELDVCDQLENLLLVK